MYQNRNFMILNVSELNKIDFSKVLETSLETVRKNSDQTKTFVKWDGERPSCISSLETKEGPYTYEEMLEILKQPEWTTSTEQYLE